MKTFFECLLASAIVGLALGILFASGVRRPDTLAPNPGVLQVGETSIICTNAQFSDGYGTFTTLDGRVLILSGGFQYFESGH